MELDWERKARELKEMSQELDMWAHKSRGREKLVLGRVSDELKRLSSQILYLLRDADDDLPFHQRDLPDWLADPVDLDSLSYEQDWYSEEDDAYDDPDAEYSDYDE